MNLLAALVASSVGPIACQPSPTAVSPHVVEQAQAAVCQALADEFETVSLTQIAKQGVPTDVAEGTRVEVGALQAGRVCVSVEWVDRERRRGKGVVWFKVSGMATGWVLDADLPAEAQLEDRHMRRKPIDIAAQGLVASDLASSPQGLTLVRSMRKGEAIRADRLRPPPMIGRRQSVRVAMRERGLTVLGRGTAITTGWKVGDAVRIQMGDGQRAVMAKVDGKGEAHVEM